MISVDNPAAVVRIHITDVGLALSMAAVANHRSCISQWAF